MVDIIGGHDWHLVDEARGATELLRYNTQDDPVSHRTTQPNVNSAMVEKPCPKLAHYLPPNLCLHLSERHFHAPVALARNV